MKATVSCQALTAAARRVLQVRRVTDTTPWSRTTLIEARDSGDIRLSAVNVDGGARELVPDAQVSRPGACALATDVFDKLVSVLPGNGDLELATDDTRLTACVGRVRQRVPLTDSLLFTWPEDRPGSWFPVTEGELRRVIRSQLWATANDPGRPALSGVHLTPEASEATNIYVMSRTTPGLVPDGIRALVPADSWPRLRAFLDGRVHGELRAAVDGRRLWLRGGNWLIFQRLMPLDDSFLNLGKLIYEPDADGLHHVDVGSGFVCRVHSLSLNRDELLTSARHVAAAAVTSDERESGAAARFMFSEGELRIVSYYPVNVLSRGLEVEEAIRWQEPSFDAVADHEPFISLSNFCFLGQYLVKALSSFDDEVVRMSWGETVVGNVPASLQFFGSRVSAVIGPRRL